MSFGFQVSDVQTRGVEDRRQGQQCPIRTSGRRQLHPIYRHTEKDSNDSQGRFAEFHLVGGGQNVGFVVVDVNPEEVEQ